MVAIARRVFAQLGAVCQVYPFLDLLTVTHTLVISRLDYSNMFLYGAVLGAGNYWCQLPRTCDTTVRELHWLLVCFWVQFKAQVVSRLLKTGLLMRQSLHSGFPGLSDLAGNA